MEEHYEEETYQYSELYPQLKYLEGLHLRLLKTKNTNSTMKKNLISKINEFENRFISSCLGCMQIGMTSSEIMDIVEQYSVSEKFKNKVRNNIMSDTEYYSHFY